MAQYIERNVNATGVYIGQLEASFNPISEDAADGDHMPEEPQEVIKFKHANDNHDFMVGSVLKPE